MPRGDLCSRLHLKHNQHILTVRNCARRLQFNILNDVNFFSVYKRGKSTLLFGAQHGSDVNEWFGIGASPDFVGTDALGAQWPFTMFPHLTDSQTLLKVNFLNSGNPNTQPDAPSTINQIIWPEYNANATGPPLFTFVDSGNTTTTPDNFRADGIQQLIDIYLDIGTK